MPADDALDELAANVAGFVVENAARLILDHIFSRHTARFFHRVGRRVIAAATLGGTRIPSSLHMVPAGESAKPRWSDWIALWVGVVSWTMLFIVADFATVHLI